jgi:hypothetical protein
MNRPLITYQNEKKKAISKENIEKEKEDLQSNDMCHIFSVLGSCV